MSKGAAGLLILSAMIGASAALAHEPRPLGDSGLQISVGFRNEPAFEDQLNAVDVFVRRADGSGVSGADNVVDLRVEVQLRTTDQFDAASVAARSSARRGSRSARHISGYLDNDEFSKD
jgi:hypothetical protein